MNVQGSAPGQAQAPASYAVYMAGCIARAFIPFGTLGGVTDDVAAGDRVMAQVRQSPWYSALLVQAGLWMIWLLPLVSLRPRLFDALPPQEQARRLTELARSPRFVVREMLMVVKLYSCMAVLGTDAALQRLSAYQHGAPITRWRAGSGS